MIFGALLALALLPGSPLPAEAHPAGPRIDTGSHRSAVPADSPPVPDTVRLWGMKSAASSDVWVPRSTSFKIWASPVDTVVSPARLWGSASGQEAAGLRMELRGRGELGGDWTSFRPCDVQVQFSCTAGLVPQVTPDLQMGLRVTGDLQDRFFVDVDYEQSREFSAANTINIFYQGQPGEILQRVEVGDVSFDLPESRFLTQGIPAGNLGLRTTGGVGPLSFQAVWAQQQGDVESTEFQLSTGGGPQAFAQQDTLVVDDVDYVAGQFFFLLDPRSILGYPHLDVLALTPGDAPADEAPGSAPIQVYRFESDPITRQQVEGYIQADGIAALDGDTVVESGWYRYLQPDVDYFVHPSGLWIGVRSPLRRDEALAVTYIASTGDTIGDYNPERIHNRGGRPRLRLLRGSEPTHQPGRPTWDTEMRQIYRISGSSQVEVATVGLSISVGELSGGRTFTRQQSGRDITFLRLFGLDNEAPVDRVDGSSIYKPADESILDQPAVSGSFLVLPTLRPFEAPPPLPRFGLTAQQTAGILGQDANPDIYNEPDPLERRSAGLFKLTVEFTIRTEEELGSFSLGALGIRDGSERIYLGDRRLRAGEDYLIDYDVGRVILLDPRSLVARFPGADLRATWEQKSIFEIAPTSVLGLGFDYDVEDRGRIRLLGLYQAERALVRRPQLGVESGSIMLGGLSGDLRFGAGWIDRMLEGLPARTLETESDLTVNGEVALSLPNPNTQDDVFLDDFDGSSDLVIPRVKELWRLGSAPLSRDGAEDVLPASLGSSDVADLVWQHTWLTQSSDEDSASVFQGFIPQEIDQQISVIGSPSRETALLLSFGRSPGQGFGRPRWRSITAVLSSTGIDLTRSEFLEFYAAEGDSLTLVIDLGTVSEDAMFVDSAQATDGTKPNGDAWGLGRLDQEADPRRGEIWSDGLDQFGVWGEGCLGSRAKVFAIGDLNANCTRGNARADTEDLDGDGNLDVTERVVRYVIPLDRTSPYLVRSRSETGTPFRLFRVPLRGMEAINPRGAFGEADWRGVKHIRFTLAGNRSQRVVFARPRIVGSRWVKRGGDGVLRGMGGDTLGVGGQVEVATASRLTEGDSYQPPPGVLEELDNPASGLSGQGVELNEQSLALRYVDVLPGERVEVFNRFPQRPRNFFVYRQARIWAVARQGDWGVGGSKFFVKVGTDPNNFYLYRTALQPAPNSGQIQPEDWLPEIVIDFNEWLLLRRKAEEFLIENPQPPSGPPLTFWSADSTYAVVLQDRARAPVLAAVRELSMGVINEGPTPTRGEVWINEFRLSKAVRTAGLAGQLDVGFQVGDLFSTSLTVSNRNAFFRQLEDEPDYFDRRVVSVRSTVQVDRFLPEGWGLDVPVTVSHSRSGEDPKFLAGTDLRTEGLMGLRTPAARSTRIGMSLRKIERTERPWLGLVLNGLDASLGYSTSRLTTVTSDREGSAVDARVAYVKEPEAREVPIVPGFMNSFVSHVLPDAWAQAIEGGRLRWTPERISVSTSYVGDESSVLRYDQIVEDPFDILLQPTRSPRSGLETAASLAFRPFRALTAAVDYLTSRDLLDPEKSVEDADVQELLRGQRASFAGVDIGWETTRSLRTRLGFEPQLGEWLRGSLNMSTNYGSYRDANLIRRRADPDDPTLALQRNASARRTTVARASADPGALGLRLAADSLSGSRVSLALARVVSALTPVTASWQSGLTSRFNRDVIDPGLSYQLGWEGGSGFRFIGSDTASFLADRSVWSAGSGIRLPASLVVNVDYSSAETSTSDTRSDRGREDRTWPNVRVALSDVPLPEGLRGLVSRLTLSSGYVRRIALTEFGGAAAQRRLTEDIRIPMDASISWAGVLNMTYRASLLSGGGTDPTGDTDRGGAFHSLAVTSSFRPPVALAVQLVRPVAVALRFTYSRQDECRVTAGSGECIPFVDQLNRSLSLSLDSSVPQMDLGLQMSLVDRRSFIGQRTGSTQFQMVLFGQFQFQADLFAGT